MAAKGVMTLRPAAVLEEDGVRGGREGEPPPSLVFGRGGGGISSESDLLKPFSSSSAS